MTRKEVEVLVNGYFRRHKIKTVEGQLLRCPPESTLRRWGSYRIIPAPSGNTRAADWAAQSLPPWVAAEIAAAVYLQESGWSIGRLWSARWPLALASGRNESLTAELVSIRKRGSVEDYSDSLTWLFATLKVLTDCSVARPATIQEHFERSIRTWQYFVSQPRKAPRGEHPMFSDRLLRVERPNAALTA